MRGEVKERLARLGKETERRRKYAELRNQTLKKIMFVRRKPVIDPHDVYHLVKDFLTLYVGEQREFTVKELRTELRSIYVSNDTRRLIEDILEEIKEIEYHEIRADHKELVDLLDKFEKAVNQLVRVRIQKKSFLSRMRNLLLKEEDDPEVILTELPAVEDGDPENIRMHMLVEKCYIALDKHRMKQAKAAYHALIEEYGSLDEEEKQSFYPLISQTYEDIRNRDT